MPATGDQGGSGGGAAQEPRAREGDRRCRDFRGPWKFWLPTYVFTDYGPLIGTNGISLYLAIAWHCTRQAHVRWPSLAQLGQEIGCSRSTVVRTMKVLVAHELLKIQPCCDSSGQKSHYLDLVHPPRYVEEPPDDGMERASAGNMTAPPCQDESAPLSNRQGGAVNLTAPSLDPEFKKEEGAKKSPPPGPSLREREENPPEAPEGPLIRAWMAAMPVLAPKVRAEVAAEVAALVAELLRQGRAPAELLASINDPTRNRLEWPREWCARIMSAAPAPAPAESAEERAARQAREREESARRVAADADQVKALAKRLRSAKNTNSTVDSCNGNG